MRVLAVIPARRGATRLADKPLRLLGGEPLVVRVLERVRALDVANDVVVATDDREVAAAVHHVGGTAVLTRPDHPSGTDRVAQVAAMAEWADASVILNVQGDEPFVDARAVRGAVEIVTSGRALIGTAAVLAPAAMLDRPDSVKVVCDDSGHAMYFSRAPIPFLREAADAAIRVPLIRLHLGIYAYTRAALERWVALPVHPLEVVERLEQLRPLAAGMAIGVAEGDPVDLGGIDTEADLVRANAHWDLIHAARSLA